MADKSKKLTDEQIDQLSKEFREKVKAVNDRIDSELMTATVIGAMFKALDAAASGVSWNMNVRVPEGNINMDFRDTRPKKHQEAYQPDTSEE